MIVWLTGPSGSGKSTVGPLLAELRGARFLDLDDEIVSRTGRTISDIFYDDGEYGFRKIETEILSSILASHRQREQLVVATGGGTVTSRFNRDMMRSSGLRIYLDVAQSIAMRRLGSNHQRPLLFDGETAWENLRSSRSVAYADHEVSVSADVPADRVALDIQQGLKGIFRSHWKVSAELNGEKTSVTAFASIYSLVRFLRRELRGRNVCVVTDQNLFNLYPYTIRRIQGRKGVAVAIPPGEESKSWLWIERIVELMARSNIGRGDVVVGFGGGVATDLAGLTASLYMRGIESLYIPTSLLAMVDASVGGKTGINAAGVRNLVGTFNQPSRVLIGPSFIRTLPFRELKGGLVESLKMGYVGSRVLKELSVDAINAILLGEGEVDLNELIRLSIATKLEMIENDVRDHGARQLLNFGHTFGHALEAVAPERWTHGEAVAFGMICAACLGRQIDAQPLTEERYEEIITQTLPLTSPDVDFPDSELIIEKMRSDKKSRKGNLRFVLPSGTRSWGTSYPAEKEAVELAIATASNRIAEYHNHTSS